jgi:4-hydroxy-tetrahydrodipicolinate reductase
VSPGSAKKVPLARGIQGVEMNPIKIVIHGACGKVGQVLLETIRPESGVQVVGAVDIKPFAASFNLPDGTSIPFSADLEQTILTTHPAVLVDFTLAPATLPAVRIAVKHKVHLVIGTTGLTAHNLAEIDSLARANEVGAVVASNFALGAVLMMKFARMAAKYMDYAEIIELHHPAKLDAPSGTALNTARAMAEFRGRPFSQSADSGKNFRSRGENVSGIPIHSVRLAGLMAHQEVILGGLGQTLTIRHDTINRECYIPGVLLAVNEVVKLRGLVQGLESLLDL